MERQSTRWCPVCRGLMSVYETMSGRYRFQCTTPGCRHEETASLLEELTSYGTLRRSVVSR